MNHFKHKNTIAMLIKVNIIEVKSVGNKFDIYIFKIYN